MATIGFKVLVAMAGNELSDNLKRALNALRCMVNALGNNTWTLIAAAYYAARQFSYEAMLVTYLDMAAEMVCTCSQDVDGLAGMLRQYGMYPSEENVAEFFGACSEAAAALIIVDDD